MIDWKNIRKFTNISPVGSRIDFTTHSLMPAFMTAALESDKCLFQLSHEGFSETAYDELVKVANDLKGRKLAEQIYNIADNQAMFLWNDAVLDIANTNGSVAIDLISLNAELTDKVKEIIKASFQAAPKKAGYVFAILRNQRGSLEISNLGEAGTSLVRENYLPSVITDYDHVVKDLASPDPTGRVIILDGPPGSGKSFLIRGILSEVIEPLFVMVPPTMVASIGGPELLPVLIKTRSTYGRRSVVLVLEDADQILAPRAADNMSGISSVLNIGDGIIGSLMDVRIIATTNFKSKDIDPAILRRGRLSRRIHVGNLPYEFANGVFQRLLKDKTKSLPETDGQEKNSMRPRSDKKTYSLADVYGLAKDNGWQSNNKCVAPTANDYQPEIADDHEQDDWL